MRNWLKILFVLAAAVLIEANDILEDAHLDTVSCAIKCWFDLNGETQYRSVFFGNTDTTLRTTE